MQFVNYRSQDDWRLGVEHQGYIVDVASLAVPSSNQLTTLRALLLAGLETMEAVLQQAKAALSAQVPGLLALETVELGPPVPDPDKIICLGLNYAEHAAEAQMNIPDTPVLFAKFRNSLVGPYSPVILPKVSTEIDYEGELAVIIGRRCKEVSVEEALSYVAGYAVFDDVSARDLQMRTSQWVLGKALDTFGPMGPGMVPASEIPDPQHLQITTRVNGTVLQQGNTEEMIFPIATIISFISSVITLEPGDIIATGTPSGVGFKRVPPIFLKEGDIVEVEIERIGLLRNPVVASGAKHAVVAGSATVPSVKAQ